MQVLSGNTDEYRHLVLSHQGRLYSLFCRQGMDAEAAEDLVQESFISAYRALNSFRFDSRFGTWLTRIALNELRSYFRSRRYKEAKRNDELDQQILESVEGPQSGAEDSLLMKRLEQVVASLSQKLREVFLLCALDGRSYEDAAMILEIPVGTVRSRLNAARTQIAAQVFQDEECQS